MMLIISDVRIHKLVLDHLGVQSVAVVIGGSMGGMAVLEWPLCTPPGYVRQILPMATSARHSAWCISWGEAQRQSIYSDPSYEDGFYTSQPASGLGAARMAALLTYRSRDSFERRFGRKPQKTHADTTLTPPRSPALPPKDASFAAHNGNYVHYISSDSESAAGSADESEPECVDEDADDAEDEDVMQVDPSWRPELWMVKVRVSDAPLRAPPGLPSRNLSSKLTLAARAPVPPDPQTPHGALGRGRRGGHPARHHPPLPPSARVRVERAALGAQRAPARPVGRPRPGRVRDRRARAGLRRAALQRVRPRARVRAPCPRPPRLRPSLGGEHQENRAREEAHAQAQGTEEGRRERGDAPLQPARGVVGGGGAR